MRSLVRRRGRTTRELSARHARHLRAQLGVAADIAITVRRREVIARLRADLRAGGERVLRGRVTVDDVLEYARQHFGLTAVPRDQAASVLRARYELRAGNVDLDTDAYCASYRPTAA
ncbi:hypothetical protein [Streptomyces griseus]|uniref:hypothetical protein n=1 Tax=Streptomyces griseus TaxID=1911 RepID=UPI00131AF7D6|nr:hypothetical protein [Streptomyces griseus]